MKKNTVYYDISTHSAFRIHSIWMDFVNIKNVSISTGRAKMGDYVYQKNLFELNTLINSGDLLRIYSPKRMYKEIQNYKSLFNTKP